MAEQSVRTLVMLAALVIIACFGAGETNVTGPAKCERPADGSPSFGCAVLTGVVVGPANEPLDGISGAIRTTPQCGCRGVPIVVDTVGQFTITVHRSLAAATTPSDTATVVVYMGATGAKYPRSVTGDPYFDTTSVQLTYAPIGSPAQVYNVRMQIPIPVK